MFSAVALLTISIEAAPLSDARVLADEIITTTTPAQNGASPTWCAGAPLLVRENGNVWTSISVHDPDEPPACRAYADRVLALPAMQEWMRAAERETETLPQFEQYA
jgi:hypothetical protein